MSIIVRFVLLHCVTFQATLCYLSSGGGESLSTTTTTDRGGSLLLPPNVPSSANSTTKDVSKLEISLGLVSVSNFTTIATFAYKNEIEFIHKRFDRSVVGDEEKDERAYSSGDVIIGGLFPVHIDDDGMLCGKILTGAGLWTESMIYAISVVNNNTNLLPDTTLGYEIRDDCSDITRALQQTLNFIDVNSGDSETCSDEVKTVGVVGTGKSLTSKAVSDLLTLFKIPQISYSATASEFSKKTRFPYFFRTVPSDKHQARVMCDIALKYKWNLVDIIYSNDNYGIEGWDELKTNFQKAGICVSESFKMIPVDSDSAKEIVTKLKDSKAEIIFTFCGKDSISKILEESKKQNMMDKTWIACDSWANSNQVVAGSEHIVQGMLGVLPKHGFDQDFVDYLMSIDALSHDNPFYKLTLEEHHNCTFSNSTTKRPCTNNDTFHDIIDTDMVWAAFTIDSVYAFAYALDDMYRNNGTGDYQSYADYIRNVSFKGVTNLKFSFDKNGDPHARYEIWNLKNDSDDQWEFQKVSEWDPEEKFQQTQHEVIQWPNGVQHPTGRCSESCPAGTHQKVGTDHPCCWTCETCQDKSYTKRADEQECIECPAGFRVNADHTDCIKNNVVYLEWSSTVSFFLIAWAIVGMMMALACLAVFIRYRQTPTIKATSTELSYVLIIGVMFSFLCTFMFLGEPTDFICNARLVMMGVSFSIYVGALLMKTHRISRIFNRKLSDGRPSIFLSIKYQLLFIVVIVMVLVSVQGIFIYSSPSKQDYNKAENVTYIQCKHDSLAGPLVIIVYNLILALLCGYQAFRIRKLPGQFNDSRSISFTILTCCLIWFIFLASMFTKNGYTKAIINCIGFIANGLSALVCMFFPKVWIIYMRPEMNVRQSTINMKNACRITISTVSGCVTLSSHFIKRNETTTINENSAANHNRSLLPVQKVEESSISTASNSEAVLESFMENLRRKEEELARMESERDVVVEQANELYKGLEDMQISHDKRMAALSEVYHTERQALLDLMEGIGLNEADLELLLERSAVNNTGSIAGDETSESCGSSVTWKDLDQCREEDNYKSNIDDKMLDEATDVLGPISRMRKRSHQYRQTVQDLSKERQHLKYTIIQQLNGASQDELMDNEEGNRSEIDSSEYEEEAEEEGAAANIKPITHSGQLYAEHESNV